MIVMKFGGSCISSRENLESLVAKVKTNFERNPILVVSAVEGVTSRLKDIAYDLFAEYKDLSKNFSHVDFGKKQAKALPYYHEILSIYNGLASDSGTRFEDTELDVDFLDSLTADSMDKERFADGILSMGERYSSRLVAKLLNDNGMFSRPYDSYKLGLITNSKPGRASLELESFGLIPRELERTHALPVITGFIGMDKKGNVTTMGRDSSDYSAVIFGVASKSKEVQMYKTVEGVLSSNSVIVERPKTIPKMSYNEAIELAAYGGNVLSLKAIKLASQHNLKIRVMNLNSNNSGTLIAKLEESDTGSVKAIISKRHNNTITISSISMIDQTGYASRIFRGIARKEGVADVVCSSGSSISATINPFVKDSKKMDQPIDMAALKDYIRRYGETEICDDKAIIAVIGETIMHRPQLLARVFASIPNEIDIEMTSLGNNSSNLTFVVDQKYEDIVVSLLHKEFFDKA